jgi:hypothetical protein
MTKSKVAKAATRSLLALGLLGTASFASTPAQAQVPNNQKSLSTNFTVVNLGSATANVNAAYYKFGNASGGGGETWDAEAGNKTFTLAANGGQKQIRQYSDAVLSQDRGGVVLSSDQQLFAIAQILARAPNPTPSSGAYAGVTAPSQKVLVPLVSKGGASASGVNNSQLVIMNTGSAATQVTVTFDNGFQKPLTIAPNASHYYDVGSEPGITGPYFGSAVVEAATGGTIAVVANLFQGPDALLTFNGFPSSSATTSWLAPLVTARLPNGLNTVVTVQNLSGAAMAAGSIKLTCTGDASGTNPNFEISNAAATANNASASFNPVSNSGFPQQTGGWVGSCKVTAPGAVVMFVQMRFVAIAGVSNPANSNNAAAYEGIPAGGTNKKVTIPLIAKKLPNGFATTVTIQNLSGTAASCNWNYQPSAEAPAGSVASSVTYPIPANGSLQHNHRLTGNGSGNGQHNLPDGWVGSLVVTCDQAADGFAQLTNVSAATGDTFMAHAAATTP